MDEEVAILRTTTGRDTTQIRAVIGGAEALALQALVRDVQVAEPVLHYVAELVRATRPGESGLPARVQKYVRWGAGLARARRWCSGAKARALLAGRMAVAPKRCRAGSPSRAAAPRASKLCRRGRGNQPRRA
jgi:MoxR-like ATPase